MLSKLFEKVKTVSTRNLLASAAKIGTLRALLFCSISSVVHDNLIDPIDAKETLLMLRPPAQKRAYTLTKAIAEEITIVSNRKKDNSFILTVSLRPRTVIGKANTSCFSKIISVAK